MCCLGSCGKLLFRDTGISGCEVHILLWMPKPVESAVWGNSLKPWTSKRNMGTTLMLSVFRLRKGKTVGEAARSWKPQTEWWQGHKDIMLFVAFTVARGASACGMKWIWFASTWKLAQFTSSPIPIQTTLPNWRLPLPAYIFIHPVSTHHSGQWVVRKSRKWEKEKKENMTLPPLLCLLFTISSVGILFNLPHLKRWHFGLHKAVVSPQAR